MNYYGTSYWAPTEYISHHGIKGMRWGVRRYQNADGSLTAAGRVRYGEDLDINDKRRNNIARIRLGEARRRYDTAKINNPTNIHRLAELKERERAAKKAVKRTKQIDRGAKLVSRGKTITGNNIKNYLTNGVIGVSSKILATSLSSIARRNPNSYYTLRTLNNIGQIYLAAVMAGANVQNYYDNKAIRAYYNASTTGSNSIKNVGSAEYIDVKNRRMGK